ncbi:hypothetical protein X772_34855 [Mesorhizobium sp. LSJC280B00]|nr:hypothetical protein X772_34855 [Mesorhizobium sp. LSJC280B00]
MMSRCRFVAISSTAMRGNCVVNPCRKVEGRHEIGGSYLWAGDLQRPDRLFLEVGHRHVCGRDLSANAATVFEIHLTAASEAYVPGGAIEKPQSQTCLKLGNALADRGFGHPDPPPGAGKAARFGDFGQKDHVVHTVQSPRPVLLSWPLYNTTDNVSV